MNNEQLDLLPYQVFISYAKEDSAKALDFFNKLSGLGIQAWIDTSNLLTGQDWKLEITRAIRNCKYILILLSKSSTVKKGYCQKEIKEALDIADLIPDGEIYIMPIRLDDCEIPDRLKKYHCCNAFIDIELNKLLNYLRGRLGIANFPLLKEQERDLKSLLSTDRIADLFLFEHFRESTRVLRSNTPSDALFISNGKCIDIRKRTPSFIKLFDEVFPNAEKKEARIFKSIIPGRNVYKDERNIIIRISCEPVKDSYRYQLVSKNGTSCMINGIYWKYISSKYQKSTLYLTQKDTPIVVEENEIIRFVFMPMIS